MEHKEYIPTLKIDCSPTLDASTVIYAFYDTQVPYNKSRDTSCCSIRGNLLNPSPSTRMVKWKMRQHAQDNGMLMAKWGKLLYTNTCFSLKTFFISAKMPKTVQYVSIPVLYYTKFHLRLFFETRQHLAEKAHRMHETCMWDVRIFQLQPQQHNAN